MESQLISIFIWYMIGVITLETLIYLLSSLVKYIKDAIIFKVK